MNKHVSLWAEQILISKKKNFYFDTIWKCPNQTNQIYDSMALRYEAGQPIC
jgi:hypothetical protein